MRACVRVCVRERERESVCVHVCLCVYVYKYIMCAWLLECPIRGCVPI